MQKGNNSVSVMDISALVGQKELAKGGKRKRIKGYSHLEAKLMC